MTHKPGHEGEDRVPTLQELGYDGTEDFTPKGVDKDEGVETPDTHSMNDPSVETEVEDKEESQ